MIPMTVVFRQHLSFPRRIHIPARCSSNRLRRFRQYRMLATILVAVMTWIFGPSSLAVSVLALIPTTIEILTRRLPAVVKPLPSLLSGHPQAKLVMNQIQMSENSVPGSEQESTGN